ncbi:MAG: class I SAM-dependent methyltransferase [Anaerolineae bacterium]|nr:class I SAM-dependent methyltransferase [Anaerolineae bacterium]
MTDEVREFYKKLASNYHFIFADWRKSVLVQSEVLDRLLKGYLHGERPTVLDCACGIGTQAIGLAVRGYIVHGTDLSTEAVERAQQEALTFQVDVTFGVADFRHLEDTVPGQFDAVIAFDNAIAHLPTSDDLELALHSMAARVAPGGVLAISLRDYDRTAQERPHSTLPVVKDDSEGRSIVFQVWDWNAAGTAYRTSFFTLRQHGDEWETLCATSDMRAWQRADVTASLAKTGLTNLIWYMPEDSGYYQPIVAARKPA